MHFSFVILHYLTENDTIECVDSILNNINYYDYSIIIVDNGSPNNSGEQIKIKYENIDKVEVILSKDNLGFAKGNNLGFIEAKNKYNADFIILMNNDMVITQKDFLNIVINKFEEQSFAVLGPNIISLVDNYGQNPQPIRINSLIDARLQLFRHIFLYGINFFRIEGLTKKIIKKIKKETNQKSFKHLEEQVDVQLHGSCLIFSSYYIQNFNGLYDKTFMYFEEDILFYLCKRFQMKMYYCPDIIVYHKEDSATNELIGNDSKKNRFIYKHSIKSINYLIKLMKKKDRMIL
ncbi:TPA: glycosyltransferase family 2 protein [Yersinia enterocolitica]|nr:glycosyltransferase family 2 protein [Yersinia enterocolitica]